MNAFCTQIHLLNWIEMVGKRFTGYESCKIADIKQLHGRDEWRHMIFGHVMSLMYAEP